MFKALHYYTLALAAFLSIALFASYSGKGGPEKQDEKTSGIPQVIKPVDLNRPFDFAGEPLPMDNFDVRERLDRELLVNTYWHSTTILNIKNAYKYFPTIERILKEQGLPEDFKYLAVAESSLRNEVSSAGARGFWQFMRGASGDFGLEVNDEVDERYHLEKSTLAACEFLKGLYKRFGSWTMAAAAYNVGAARLAREASEQRATNYYDLNLNSETSRYVFRLVAIKEIMGHPNDFGFYIEKEDRYPPLEDYKTVTVDGPVANWGDFAVEHGTSYRMLKVYNPWLVDSKLTNRSGKTYEIRLPK
ncbi:MAG: transglycosylase SLT domain-containing protein [Phaeodactylibacter sp.]|nr:transglycosylase SLT domain-containing protein [Phaeodactylibacter sp.]MCB9275546.1 transglycosylase SLT domain-containing protein [Lewinellaceae bacterium]